ncbi:hypothetical protein LIA77_11301 [Sarocladium implicatum]|nr:hypothetical protein LIA77_11301 [Sarocladium implicatum]
MHPEPPSLGLLHAQCGLRVPSNVKVACTCCISQESSPKRGSTKNQQFSVVALPPRVCATRFGNARARALRSGTATFFARCYIDNDSGLFGAYFTFGVITARCGVIVVWAFGSGRCCPYSTQCWTRGKRFNVHDRADQRSWRLGQRGWRTWLICRRAIRAAPEND